MTTNIYANSTVTNNYNEVKKGYIHVDELFPALYQAQAILALITGDDNDMEDAVRNSAWAAHGIITASLDRLKNI